ncbi:MAG: hypothetical protein AB8B64_22390 [Granulosicoccus sp.]
MLLCGAFVTSACNSGNEPVTSTTAKRNVGVISLTSTEGETRKKIFASFSELEEAIDSQEQEVLIGFFIPDTGT